MKFTTNKEQRDFFYKEGFVEFVGVLSPQQIEEVRGEAHKIIAERLRVSERSLPLRTQEELYLQGRDLWRASELIRKIVCGKALAQVAAELFDTKPLRLGFDQFFSGGSFFKENFSLRECSSLQGVLGGVIITLKEGQQEGDSPSIFSALPGSIVVFKPDAALDFLALSKENAGEYLLVAYTQQKTVYINQEKDLHTHALKKWGYVFGDRLKEETHPTVWS